MRREVLEVKKCACVARRIWNDRAGSWDGNIISSRTLHLLGRRQGKVMEGVLNLNPNEKGQTHPLSTPAQRKPTQAYDRGWAAPVL